MPTRETESVIWRIMQARKVFVAVDPAYHGAPKPVLVPVSQATALFIVGLARPGQEPTDTLTEEGHLILHPVEHA